ncbi:MAG: ComEA family DNA-binding protein [Sphaerobacter sp.]|nr:ComEA family DNA-binding protein [Sphaerobacter sp.]
MELTRARLLLLGVAATITVAVLTVVLLAQQSQDVVVQIEPVGDPRTLTVYVGGAVRTPGLYTLARGSRLAEAVEQAGLLPEADIAGLPMAEPLRDGQSVVVPRQRPTPPPVPLGSSPRLAVSEAPGLVNINTASQAELERLPGIGPVLAQRIITYRTEHGPFATLDDLAAVRGISARMVESLQGLATTGT